jgi:serine/threonine protein kinase
MSTGTQTCEIVLPGYTLTERIGSGGYAEVWRAEAPGGIEKAVKIVYGYYDDEFASQELKALERIKGVRHPFLLSLERFEILNGRLAILTELADMSLDQRLRQCRGEGRAGIPRDELLRYMADAAEALDFLSQRHNLLHLDIKPENLLILGDHIKVADFGLVKEIATRTQNSLVSGMTPTYAAPEVFDDDPSPQSDQYSLAIVYQEMLVGTLPFPGRTAAQLAKQHTQAEPQLASVPVEDRPVLARALAKQPTKRFESCKAFVDAIQGRSRSMSVAAAVDHSPSPRSVPTTSPPEADDTKPPSFHPTLRIAPEPKPEQHEVQVTRPVHRSAGDAALSQREPASPPQPFIPEETIDVAVPPQNADMLRAQPTLYIAAGGMGIQVLCRLLERLEGIGGSIRMNSLTDAIAIDTDRDELRKACHSLNKTGFSTADTLHVPLKLPQNYDNSREILDWVSRRWLYNIPRSLETRGYRPLGRVALVDHAQQVIELIERKLAKLSTAAHDAASTGNKLDSRVKVVLLASMGGGAGSGMVLDIGNAVKSVAANQNLQVEVHAYLLCTCLSGSIASPLLAANSFSLLTELNHAACHGNRTSNKKTPLAELFESEESPFDHIYCIPAHAQKADAQAMDASDMLARYLKLDYSADARAALRSCRSAPTAREYRQPKQLSLKKLAYASLGDQARLFVHYLAAELASAVKQYWASTDNNAERDAAAHPMPDRNPQSAHGVQFEPGVDSTQFSTIVVAPLDDISPVALRDRFEKYKTLEFASEVLRQIQLLREADDQRNRPRILPRDFVTMVESARAFAATLVGEQLPNTTNRFLSSARLRSVVTAASHVVLRSEVQEFDPKNPERFLKHAGLDERIQCECLSVLQQQLDEAEVQTAIASLVDDTTAATATLESATLNLLGCGSDRRTLIFIPRGEDRQATVEKLRKARPLASILTADVDDLSVVVEESSISPRSVAMGLERMYPGIADAAHRLHTRTDIQWENLAQSIR